MQTSKTAKLPAPMERSPVVHFTINDETTEDSEAEVVLREKPNRLPKSASAQPIAIPLSGGCMQRNSSQRHTNFTPPRSYNMAGGRSPMVSLQSMTRSGSVPKDLVFQFDWTSKPLGLEREALRPVDWRRHSMMSEPNFRSRVVEREVGHDLRVISDIFHIQSAGFGYRYDFMQSHGYDFVQGHGYDFAGHRDPTRYSSSFPGATRRRVDQGWQSVIQSMSPRNFNPAPELPDSFRLEDP